MKIEKENFVENSIFGLETMKVAKTGKFFNEEESRSAEKRK